MLVGRLQRGIWVHWWSMGAATITVGGGSRRIFLVELAAERGRKGREKLPRLARGARQWLMDLGEEPQTKDRGAFHTWTAGALELPGCP